MAILEPALAQKFIDKTAGSLEYNINIMNDKGIIIASKDSTRIGNFHEVASKMLNGSLETGVVSEDKKYLGTRPGVNLFIDHKSRHVGVICVSGPPGTVAAFAALVKISVEAMLEYETQIRADRLWKDKADQLAWYLLSEEHTDRAAAESMAEELQLSPEMVRVCLLVHPAPGSDIQHLTEVFVASGDFSRQDMIIRSRTDDLIILKACGTRIDEAVKSCRQYLTDFTEDCRERLLQDGFTDTFSCFAGSLQNRVEKYRSSYLHAQELMMKTKDKKGIFFFQDHLLDHFRSIVTISPYREALNVYDSLFGEDERRMLTETVAALSASNYNVANTSRAMFIHRNTLLFRLAKLKDMLGIDPISCAADREFLNELAYYFSKK